MAHVPSPSFAWKVGQQRVQLQWAPPEHNGGALTEGYQAPEEALIMSLGRRV